MTCWAYSSTNNCTNTAAPCHPSPAAQEVHTSQASTAPQQPPLHAQEQLEVLQPGQVHQSRHLQPGQVSEGGRERDVH